MRHLIEPFRGIPKNIWMLSFVSFINRVGSIVIAFATIYLTEELHFSIVDAGYIMTIFGVGAVFGAFLGGKATDKYGYQIVQIVTLLASGVLLLILYEQKTFWNIAFVLFVLNVFSEGFRPANSVAIRINSNDENRLRSFSMMRFWVNLAMAFAMAIGGFLFSLGSQYMFWADSFTCFAAAGFIYFFIPAVKKTPKENNPIKEENPRNANSDSPYRDKVFLLFVLMTFLGAMAFMQILWTIPPFFSDIYKWDKKTIGLIVAINGLIVMLVELPLVFSIEGKRSNQWFVRLGLALYAISYLAFVLPIEYAYSLAVFYMIAISFGEIFVMPFSSTWVTKIAPKATQGDYFSLYVIAYSLANVLAPLMGTQIVDRFGYTTLWYVVAGISLTAMLGFFYVEKKDNA
jgi:predicted MFS family arabinose efflux permease